MIKLASVGGSLLVVIALVIALLKGAVALVAIVASAVKLIVILAFIAVFAGIGFMIFRAWQENRRGSAAG